MFYYKLFVISLAITRLKPKKSEKKEAFSLFPAIHRPREIIFRIMQNYQQTLNPVEKNDTKKCFIGKIFA